MTEPNSEWHPVVTVPLDRAVLHLLRAPTRRTTPRIRKKWRKPQGIIFGKRCGVTQNLNTAARFVV